MHESTCLMGLLLIAAFCGVIAAALEENSNIELKRKIMTADSIAELRSEVMIESISRGK